MVSSCRFATAFAMCKWRPISTFSIKMRVAAPATTELTRTRGESTERSTRPPEMMHTLAHQRVGRAPRRFCSSSLKTNFAGGSEVVA